METKAEVATSPASVFHILTKHMLQWKKICAKWVSLLLHDNYCITYMLLTTIQFHLWQTITRTLTDCVLMYNRITDATTEAEGYKMACTNLTMEDDCMMQSACSESDACHAVMLSQASV
jgi:hypothetical protein